ncbi:MAG: NUDIX hydrolase [Gammaproteobacteria bacterium]|nr:MAG: NUDIX hydrolase [Gammaproteobacteria bacterium]PIE37683.1 MAG: NUDIX hydrolase [Gammaproteobacteria bacterium]
MDELRYCPRCGSGACREVPAGDNRERLVCPNCEYIHYENPRNVVGCVLEWEGKVLLAKRAIEPRLGFWTVPAGFMENGESTVEGAEREAWEEARARCENLRLFAVYNVPRINQVHLFFHGRLVGGKAATGEESLDVRLFDEEDIPWDELAFTVNTEVLERFRERREQRVWQVYHADIIHAPGEPPRVVRHRG